ncbi:F0F1 ATP synthase subunit epsilon [Pseudophaeobacter sp. A-200-2]|uniref:F0F1 ATP synthase subunit epsilon n=1 Tax=Pseudophaeobacter sp. A-200-2 TaxID=3098145 RepID=UPI0034D48646
MKLVVATPTEIVEDVDDIVSVRASDDTGAFGIQPGHADFLAVLPISVVSWRTKTRSGVVVIRGGILTVQGGIRIDIAARGAWREDQLSDLGPSALAELQREDSDEDVTRKSEHRLHLATMRQIERLLRGARKETTTPRLDAGASPGAGEARS